MLIDYKPGICIAIEKVKIDNFGSLRMPLSVSGVIHYFADLVLYVKACGIYALVHPDFYTCGPICEHITAEEGIFSCKTIYEGILVSDEYKDTELYASFKSYQASEKYPEWYEEKWRDLKLSDILEIVVELNKYGFQQLRKEGWRCVEFGEIGTVIMYLRQKEKLRYRRNKECEQVEVCKVTVDSEKLENLLKESIEGGEVKIVYNGNQEWKELDFYDLPSDIFKEDKYEIQKYNQAYSEWQPYVSWSINKFKALEEADKYKYKLRYRENHHDCEKYICPKCGHESADIKEHVEHRAYQKCFENGTPRHNDIMNLWWKDLFFWAKVTYYDPMKSDGKKYFIGDRWRNASYFVGRESSVTPPEWR